MERVLPLPRVDISILTSRNEKKENATITAFSLLKGQSMLQGGIFVKPVSEQVVCTCGEYAFQNFCSIRGCVDEHPWRQLVQTFCQQRC